MLIKDHDLILFQGDSVTDAGRNKEDPNDLGKGYPMIIAGWIAATYPELQVKFINRGIGGNRVKDLKARWEKDCLELKPTLVSIMIGINDCWRRYDRNDPTSLEQFTADYRAIIQATKEQLNARLVLIEPFVLPMKEEQRRWREDLDPKINAVRDLAREFGALLLPMDGIFNQYSTRRDSAFWTKDGVHPTVAGHALIAREWLQLMRAV